MDFLFQSGRARIRSSTSDRGIGFLPKAPHPDFVPGLGGSADRSARFQIGQPWLHRNALPASRLIPDLDQLAAAVLLSSGKNRGCLEKAGARQLSEWHPQSQDTVRNGPVLTRSHPGLAHKGPGRGRLSRDKKGE